MKHNQTRDTHRLHIPTRRDLRDIAVAASAVVAAGVFTIAAGDRILADAGTAPTAAPTPTDECGGLWDRVAVSGEPDRTVESLAADVGLVTRGSWISLDGVTWEHVDGRIVVVAHPRSATHDPACTNPTDGSSRP